MPFNMSSIPLNKTRLMASKFPGKCAHCKKPFAKGDQVKYNFDIRAAFCPDCLEQSITDISGPSGFDVHLPIGYYTVMSSGIERTFRVHTSYHGSYAGKQMFQQCEGSVWVNIAFYSPTRIALFTKHRGDTDLISLLTLLVKGENWRAFAIAFAQKYKECWRCRASLSVPLDPHNEGFCVTCIGTSGWSKIKSAPYIWEY